MIAMHDKAMLAMSKGAYLEASDIAKVYFEGRTECFMLEDNVINIFKELIDYSVKINM